MIDEKWKYWLIAFIGSEEEPQVLHIAGYENPVGPPHAAKLNDEMQSDPDFKINSEYLDQLKIGEISDTEARSFLVTHAKQMDNVIYENQIEPSK